MQKLKLSQRSTHLHVTGDSVGAHKDSFLAPSWYKVTQQTATVGHAQKCSMIQRGTHYEKGMGCWIMTRLFDLDEEQRCGLTPLTLREQILDVQIRRMDVFDLSCGLRLSCMAPLSKEKFKVHKHAPTLQYSPSKDLYHWPWILRSLSGMTTGKDFILKPPFKAL